MKLFNSRKNVSEQIKINEIEFNILSKTKQNIVLLNYFKELAQLNIWELNNSWIFGYAECYPHIMMLYKVINESMCIFLFNDINNYIELFALPLGNTSDYETYSKTIFECFSIIKKITKETPKIMNFHNNSLNIDLFNKIKADERFKIRRNNTWCEFTNDINKIVDLNGKEYAYMRREVNYFIKNNPTFLFRDYNDADYKACMKLRSIWSKQAQEVYGEDGINCDEIYQFMLEHHEELDTHIYVCEIDNEIKGVVTYEELFGEHCACVFRISDHNSINLSKYLAYAVIRKASELGYEFMNDGGSPDEALISFKQKFRGERYEFYTIYLR